MLDDLFEDGPTALPFVEDLGEIRTRFRTGMALRYGFEHLGLDEVDDGSDEGDDVLHGYALSVIVPPPAPPPLPHTPSPPSSPVIPLSYQLPLYAAASLGQNVALRASSGSGYPSLRPQMDPRPKPPPLVLHPGFFSTEVGVPNPLSPRAPLSPMSPIIGEDGGLTPPWYGVLGPVPTVYSPIPTSPPPVPSKGGRKKEKRRIHRANQRATQREAAKKAPYKPSECIHRKYRRPKHVRLVNFNMSVRRGAMGAYIGVGRRADLLLRTLKQLLKRGMRLFEWDGRCVLARVSLSHSC